MDVPINYAMIRPKTLTDVGRLNIASYMLRLVVGCTLAPKASYTAPTTHSSSQRAKGWEWQKMAIFEARFLYPQA